MPETLPEQSATERKSVTCPDCGAECCHIRIKGEWVLGDWGPAVPVIDFSNIVVAVNGGYHKMEDGEIKRDDLAFDAYPIGAPPAAVLIQRHDCKALVRYRGYATAEMQRHMEATRS